MIVYSVARSADLEVQSEENNPLVLWSNDAGSYAVAAGTESGGPAANLASDGTYSFCYPTVSSGEYIITFTTTEDVTAVAIAAHNFGTIGATVAVEYNDGGWVDCGAGSVTPTDNQAIMWRFMPNSATSWRLRITGSVSAQPAIAILWAGAELVFPRRFYAGYEPPIRPNNSSAMSNVSMGGQYWGASVVTAGSTTSIEIQHLPPTFIRGADFLSFYDRHKAAGTFFFAWRPMKYGDLFYAWSDGTAMRPRNMGVKDLMSISMPLRFYDDP